MHFLSLGGLLARLELEEKLWAVPKLLNLVMLQFIPAAAYFELPWMFPFCCWHSPPPTKAGSAVSRVQANPSPPSSSGYVTDQINNANLPKGVYPFIGSLATPWRREGQVCCARSCKKR